MQVILFLSLSQHLSFGTTKTLRLTGNQYFGNNGKDKVFFIQDLLSENNSWLSHNEFETKYNLQCNFLNYICLISAISKHWKCVKNYEMHNKCINDYDEQSTLFKTVAGFKIYYLIL